MKLILRVPVLLAMVWLVLEAVVAYACQFKDGYPLWPLVGLATCCWAYTRLRPAHSKPRAVVYDGQSLESTLFFFFAAVAAGVVLNVRGEKALEPWWYLHLAVLTFSLLLIPYLIGRPFVRARSFVTALSAFIFFGLLLKGDDLGCCSITALLRNPPSSVLPLKNFPQQVGYARTP